MSLQVQSVLILAVWWLSTAAKGYLVWRLATNRLLRHYPVFSLMAASQFLLSSVLMAVGGAIGKAHPYAEFWAATRAPIIAIEIAAVLELIWMLVRSFPSIGPFAVRCVLPVVIGIAGGGAFLVSSGHNNWFDQFSRYVQFREWADFLLAVTCILSIGFFLQFGNVIRRNVLTIGYGFCVLWGSFSVAGYLMGSSHGQRIFWYNIVLSGGALAAYMIWGIRIMAAGEELSDSGPAVKPIEFEHLEEEDSSTTPCYRGLAPTCQQIASVATQPVRR